MFLTSNVYAQSPVQTKFLSEHCIACHSGGEDADAGLDLENVSFDLHDPKGFRKWSRIVDRVAKREMPPESEVQPSAGERERFVDATTNDLVESNRRQQQKLGRTTIRRLNRREYERTVQDLLGITKPLAHMLPEETPLHGFDTVSDALRFSALHIDHYLEAADAALDEAIVLTEQPEPVHERFQYTEQAGVLKNLKEDHVVVRLLDNAAVFFGEVSYLSKVHGLEIQQPGLYRIRTRAWGIQSERPIVLGLHSGDYKSGTVRSLGYFELPIDEPSEVEVIARLERGTYLYPQGDELWANPADGNNVWNVGGEKYAGAGLAVEWVEVEGPLESTWPPQRTNDLLLDVPLAKREHVLWKDEKRIAYEPQPQNPQAAVEAAVTRFAVRAFRRPASEVQADRFVKLALDALEAGRFFEDACHIGMRAVLCSPQFLILQEQPGRLDDYALASRLSYFLCGTTPDKTLLQLAAEGKLADTAVLREQTERLLSDNRSDAFVEDFVNQWLDLQRIDATSPDKKLYPEFDDILKQSMLSESYAFFRELIDKDLPVANVVESDFAMLNRRLAEHYDISNVAGHDIRRVSLADDSVRGGILSQAAVLKVTANGTVSSPVTRGTWVMSRILGQHPSPPPPAVGSIEPDTRGATTIREQLDLHRRDPSCASCHRQIDPPGFAMECFDVIGGFRDRYRSSGEGDRPQERLRGRNIWEYKIGLPVDNSGQMPDGTEFQNFHEFRKLLLRDSDQIAKSLASHLTVYATGEEIEIADRATIRQIVEQTQSSGNGVRSLIHAIVQSDLFRNK